MHAASELVRSRSLKTCTKSTFSDIQPHFYRYTSQWARSALPCSLLSPQSLSPLSSLRISSTFFILLSAPEDVSSILRMSSQKEVSSFKVQSWGLFHILLNTLSYFLLLEPVNLEHNTPPHSYPHVMIESRLLYKDVSFSPLQHNAGNIPISDVL